MASKKFLVGLDLNKNELQNARIQNLGTAPSTPVAGQIYYNTADNTLYFYNGTSWVNFVQTTQVQYNTFANRPAANTVPAGTLFFATDTNLLYLSDASVWDQISSFGSVSAQTSYGDTSGNGTSNDYARADHTHGTPSLTSTAPQTLAAGGTNVVGTAITPARADHVHALPNFGNVSAQTTFGASSANGSGTEFARNDHTHGTPVHDNAAHSAINLSALAVPTADVSIGGFKLTNVATPTASTDAANKGYVDAAVEGLTWKTAANLFASSNVALTGNTNTLNIDTYGALTSADNGYRIVLSNQTTDTEDGIYVYSDNGTTYTLSRSADGSTYQELEGATIYILEGTTKAGTSWTQSNHYLTSFAGQTWVQLAGPGTFTEGNGIDITSNVISAVAGTGITVTSGGINIDTATVVTKYAANVGNGSSQAITVTHNLNTRDVIVSVYDNSSPYAEVVCDVEHTSTTAITLNFTVAPTSNQYRVVVHA
jgi:hypothetical protein